jgi:hypothetical protein
MIIDFDTYGAARIITVIGQWRGSGVNGLG